MTSDRTIWRQLLPSVKLQCKWIYADFTPTQSFLWTQSTDTYFNGFGHINHAMANFSYVMKLILDITGFGFCTCEISKTSLAIDKYCSYGSVKLLPIWNCAIKMVTVVKQTVCWVLNLLHWNYNHTEKHNSLWCKTFQWKLNLDHVLNNRWKMKLSWY
jgi:hypothetical protein